jgi:hypothetical protein
LIIEWHSRGRRFDPVQLHQKNKGVSEISLAPFPLMFNLLLTQKKIIDQPLSQNHPQEQQPLQTSYERDPLFKAWAFRMPMDPRIFSSHAKRLS